MAKVVPFILGLLVLAACNDNDSPPVPARSSTSVPMNAEAWSIRYSPGMPPHPTPQTGGGSYLDFPTDPNSVHYVLAAVNMAASSAWAEFAENATGLSRARKSQGRTEELGT